MEKGYKQDIIGACLSLKDVEDDLKNKIENKILNG